MAEQHLQDIELAEKTLEFIGSLRDEDIPSNQHSQMREIVANLCDFQYRFSMPMELPFEMGHDLEEELPVRRPVAVLLRFKYAYPLPEDLKESEEDTDPQDRMIAEDGKHYFFAGQETWKKFVDEGKITGDEAVAPNLTAHEWLPGLFDLFGHTTALDANRRAVARRLAACWYHISTQVLFEPENQPEDEELALAMHPANLMLSIMAGGIPLGGDGEEGDEEEFGDDVEEDGEPGQPSFAELLQSAADDDGEEDDEYDPSKDPDGGDDVEDEEMDAEDGDEVEDGMDTENQNSFASLLAQSLKLTDEEQDADDDYDPTRDQDDGNDDEDGMDVDDGAEVANGDDDNDDEPPELEGEMLELFQKEKQFRDHILGVVQNLSAFWPDPSSDLPWVKRVLKHMSAAATHGETEWYPWGVPPLEPLKKSLQSQDTHEVQYAVNVLSMFQAHADQQ